MAISKKGGARRSKLLCNNPDPSPFTADTAPYDNGWLARYTLAKNKPDEDPATADLRSINLDAVIQGVYSGKIDGVVISNSYDANIYYEWYHTRQDWFYTQVLYGNIPSGIFSPFGPTGARYANIINPKAGLIVCVGNYGPDWMIRQAAAEVPSRTIGPAPPLSHLSDVLFFQWKFACAKRPYARGKGPTGHVTPIKLLDYIFQRSIADEETKRVVDIITSIPGHDIIAWPGRYYSFTQDNQPTDMEKSFAFALLGTPQGASAAFLLLQHSDDLGLKVPKGVRVFGTPLDRNMMFYLETPNADSADLTPPGERQLR
ncbi:hypothetical protein LTR17_005173 [Elasticomyces elasticus]|nr:hypothetical protein LTR17_005173 [Elasticomyces elasticus]